jgi:hypothetical protein
MCQHVSTALLQCVCWLFSVIAGAPLFSISHAHLLTVESIAAASPSFAQVCALCVWLVSGWTCVCGLGVFLFDLMPHNINALASI